jgi:ubiquinone/menaquinone biosynthesis C-methylase UbiE
MINESPEGNESAVVIQRAYYATTAESYDLMHGEEREDSLCFPFLLAAVDYLEVRSVLDVGSGTGAAVRKIKTDRQGVAAVGVEPSPELRKIGHAKGLSEAELIDGDAMNLGFADGSFDLVCEFAALHHIPEPSRAVAEMLRIARKAVFIADSNNFGQGSRFARLLKQTIHAFGLWPLADYIKTRGKGYTISKGDGLAYSYSVFDDYEQISRACKSVHLLNTGGVGPNLYRSASSVALLGIKK